MGRSVQDPRRHEPWVTVTHDMQNSHEGQLRRSLWGWYDFWLGSTFVGFSFQSVCFVREQVSGSLVKEDSPCVSSCRWCSIQTIHYQPHFILRHHETLSTGGVFVACWSACRPWQRRQPGWNHYLLDFIVAVFFDVGACTAQHAVEAPVAKLCICLRLSCARWRVCLWGWNSKGGTKGLPSSNWFLFFCMKSAAGLPDMLLSGTFLLLLLLRAGENQFFKPGSCCTTGCHGEGHWPWQPHLEATLLGPLGAKSQGPGSQCYTAVFNAPYLDALHPFRSIGW